MKRSFSLDRPERVLIARALGHNPDSDKIQSVARQFNRSPSQVSAIAAGRA